VRPASISVNHSDWSGPGSKVRIATRTFSVSSTRFCAGAATRHECCHATSVAALHVNLAGRADTLFSSTTPPRSSTRCRVACPGNQHLPSRPSSPMPPRRPSPILLHPSRRHRDHRRVITDDAMEKATDRRLFASGQRLHGTCRPGAHRAWQSTSHPSRGTSKSHHSKGYSPPDGPRRSLLSKGLPQLADGACCPAIRTPTGGRSRALGGHVRRGEPGIAILAPASTAPTTSTNPTPASPPPPQSCAGSRPVATSAASRTGPHATVEVPHRLAFRPTTAYPNGHAPCIPPAAGDARPVGGRPARSRPPPCSPGPTARALAPAVRHPPPATRRSCALARP
jgi:hypothetical protein